MTLRTTATVLLLAISLPALSACATPNGPHTADAPNTAVINRVPYVEAVKDLYARLHPLCANITAANFAPAQALADQYRRDIAGTRYALLYDDAVTEAAAARAQRAMLVRCAMPDDAPNDAERQRITAETRTAVTHLRAMSNTPE